MTRPGTDNTGIDLRGPIGVFDSGFGGLSVLQSLVERLPQYAYMYLGDNARAPYGTRTFDQVYEYTLEAVQYLFGQGCPLVILACNTASAKALRTIQQRWLPYSADPTRRVLGVIRPTAEVVGEISRNGHVGVVATPGTIASQSYDIEIKKLNPHFTVTGHACPMWVHLVEHGYADSPGADFFVREDLGQLLASDGEIDTILLGCTHYPHLLVKIESALSELATREIRVIPQGEIVAQSLADYLERHPEMASRLTPACGSSPAVTYLTTDDTTRFATTATALLGHTLPPATVHSVTL